MRIAQIIYAILVVLQLKDTSAIEASSIDATTQPKVASVAEQTSDSELDKENEAGVAFDQFEAPEASPEEDGGASTGAPLLKTNERNVHVDFDWFKQEVI